MTSGQGWLFPPRRKVTYAEQFAEFHKENPEVYEALCTLARRVKARGFKQYGIAGIYEVLRYNRALATNGEPFKLSNNYKAYYSRLIMEQEPDLEGFFTTREMTAE